MKLGGLFACVLVTSVLILSACATQQSAQKDGSAPPADQGAGTTTHAEPQVKPAEPVKSPPNAEFVASEELYKKTFDEVQAVIASLTAIIAAADYSQWLTYLTADYIAETGSASHLAAASSAGVLKKNGIVLHDLRDYFNEVVVRSHLQATLDDINFVDASHVKAITKIQNKPVILYYLVREDGRWKVGIQQSTQGS